MYFSQGCVCLCKLPHVLLNSRAKQPYCHFFFLKLLETSHGSALGYGRERWSPIPSGLAGTVKKRRVIGMRSSLKPQLCHILAAAILTCSTWMAMLTWQRFPVAQERVDTGISQELSEYFSLAYLGFYFKGLHSANFPFLQSDTCSTHFLIKRYIYIQGNNLWTKTYTLKKYKMLTGYKPNSLQWLPMGRMGLGRDIREYVICKSHFIRESSEQM